MEDIKKYLEKEAIYYENNIYIFKYFSIEIKNKSLFFFIPFNNGDIIIAYKILNIIYNFEKYIPNHFVELKTEGYEWGCPEYLLFVIEYNHKPTKDLIKEILFINNDNNIDFYAINILPLNYKTSSITTLNIQTKCRRLAYLRLILLLFKQSLYYPQKYLTRLIELKASEINKYLDKYRSNKGIIKISSTGISSKPYLELLIDLDLLFKSNYIQITKYGKVYLKLIEKLMVKQENFFELAIFEKVFFLFLFLKKDELYLTILLELIYITKKENIFSLKSLKKEFQSYLNKELNELLYSVKIPNKEKIKIKDRIKRVKNWKKPDIYLEHIIDPRINWLLDLDFIDINSNQYKVTKKFIKLFHYIIEFYDEFEVKYVNNKIILESFYFSIVNDIYEIEAKYLTMNEINLIEKYLEESFIVFKTFAPNKVTFSQSSLYICFMLLFKENKIININDIKKYIKNHPKYYLEWYEKENDGSVRRK